MSKYCSENVKIRRNYTLYLEAATGRQSTTADVALRAIERFEISTNRKPFKKFHREQARSFRADLLEATGPTGAPLSSATVAATLKHLRNFFLWLSREPGYRLAINSNDAAYFTPTDQDLRIASARREQRVATLDEIKLVLSLMPSKTPIEKRNRALIAFAILSGARDGALASFRLKHLDMATQTVFHDGRVVRTKGRKTFKSSFFPVGSEPLEIVADYIAMLKDELGFGPEDPLFPTTRVGHGVERAFEAQGLSRSVWTTSEPIRVIFRTAFVGAGLQYVKPHSFRTTLGRLGEALCRTPEEWKAWSQNLGHESETTTFAGYGEVPGHRQAEILRSFGERSLDPATNEIVSALEALVRMAKGELKPLAGALQHAALSDCTCDQHQQRDAANLHQSSKQPKASL
jgi:integrase